MPIIRVLPDVPAVDRPFDYLSDDHLRVGTVVRVPFGGRRVRGWVVDTDVDDPGGRNLLSVSKVVGVGPDAEIIDLCRWVAWRWAGRLATIMRLATPDRSVPVPRGGGIGRGAGTAPRGRAAGGFAERARRVNDAPLTELSGSVLRSRPGAHVLRTAPTSDAAEIALASVGFGQVIVVTPSPIEADRLTRRLRATGTRVARWPEDWAQAAAGATVIGTRGAVFAPAPFLNAIIVLDEHDPRLQSESSPTWHAREVAVERCRRRGIPSLLVSPCPTLEAFRAQAGLELLTEPAPDPDDPPSSGRARIPRVLVPAFSVSRSVGRSGWAPTIVVDRRGEDVGRSGLFSSALVEMMRGCLAEGRPVTCVLNRTGRSRLLACRSCSSIVTCHECGSSMHQPDPGTLLCGACGASRPAVCAECGSTALAGFRPGVSRAGEELEALVGVPVGQVTAGTGSQRSVAVMGATVVMGTTAVMGSVTPGGLVAFVDFDQELLARRYRAAEDALALLVEASRMVGGRYHGGTIAVQTRIPEHEVLNAAVTANPAVVSAVEFRRRSMLGLPPIGSVAWIAGEAAAGFVERLASPDGVAVTDAGTGEWLARSRVPGRLQDALAEVVRPTGRLRLQVDPHRLGR